LGKCGPWPVFASYTLVFAVQLRKEHGKIEKDFAVPQICCDVEISFVDGTKIMLLDVIPYQCPSSTSVNHKNVRPWCDCGSLNGTASTAEIRQHWWQLQLNWIDGKYAAGSSKPSVTHYQYIRSHISEDCNLHI